MANSINSSSGYFQSKVTISFSLFLSLTQYLVAFTSLPKQNLKTLPSKFYRFSFPSSSLVQVHFSNVVLDRGSRVSHGFSWVPQPWELLRMQREGCAWHTGLLSLLTSKQLCSFHNKCIYSMYWVIAMSLFTLNTNLLPQVFPFFLFTLPLNNFSQSSFLFG